MSREFDLVVFGATGFTGAKIVDYLASLDEDELTTKNYSWAIAGRSQTKLQAIADRCQANQKPGIIIADCSNPASLAEMCKRTRLVLSAVGPYRFFGESVVRAAVAQKTHYLDVTGEPQFMESMCVEYDEQAKEDGTVIVNACGFDSIPADLGVLFASSLFPNGQLISVESFLSLGFPENSRGAHGHFTTWQSAVEGFGDVSTLRRVRAKQRRVREADPNYTKVPRRKSHPKHKLPYREKRVGGAWALPFPGSDASVCRRSLDSMFQQQVQEPDSAANPVSPPTVSFHFTIQSTLWVVVVVIAGLVLQVLAGFAWGRRLLLRYPRLFTFGAFSHDGPCEETLNGSSFRFDMFARGMDAKDENEAKVAHVVIQGPEIGYVATPICLVQSALALLESRDSELTGGVLTPAAAFANTTLLARLEKAGISFQVE